MNVSLLLNNTAISDYIRHFAVKLKQAAATALGRDVTVTTDSSNGEWRLILSAGKVKTLAVIGGVIPVTRQNQFGTVINAASEMQAKLLEDIVQRIIRELWPLYVKRILRVNAG